MNDTYLTNWHMIALRGLIAVIFATTIFLWPGITLLMLLLLFGSYALVDGIFALITAVQTMRRHARWQPLLLEAITGIGIGILTYIWPQVTALTLLYFIAFWAILMGVLEIAGAIQLRKEIEGEWLLGLSGLLSIIFGLLLIINPQAGAVAFVWMIAIYSFAFGSLLLALAFRLYRRQHTHSDMLPPNVPAH